MNNSSNANSDSDERVDLPSDCSKYLNEWVVFRGFLSCALFENLSRQYVNSMNCMIFGAVDIVGGWLSVWVPNMHNMSSMSLAKYVQSVAGHVHWSS